MRNPTHIALTLAAAATISFAGTAVAQQSTNDNPSQQVQRQDMQQRQMQQQQDVQAPRGQGEMNEQDAQAVLVVFGVTTQRSAIQPVAVGEKDDILEIISEATEAAVTEDGFDDVVERLNDQDRNRLGEAAGGWFTPNEQEALNQAAAAFREAWQAKYNSEFSMEDISKVYDDGVIAQAEIINPSLMLDNWPVPVTQQAQQAAGGVDNLPEEDLDDIIEDRNLGAGRDIAVVQLDAMAGLPEMRISFLYEFPGVWKIDIPNSVDGDTAVANLTNTLTTLTQNADAWPADQQQAYALVSRMVIASLYDADVNLGGQQ